MGLCAALIVILVLPYAEFMKSLFQVWGANTEFAHWILIPPIVAGLVGYIWGRECFRIGFLPLSLLNGAHTFIRIWRTELAPKSSFELDFLIEAPLEGEEQESDQARLEKFRSDCLPSLDLALPR
jgi:hypothetical protein